MYGKDDRLPTLRLTDGCRVKLRLVREIQKVNTDNGPANVCTVEVLDLGGGMIDTAGAAGDNPPNVATLWPSDRLAIMMRQVDEDTEGDAMIIRRRGGGKATRWFVKPAAPPPAVKPAEGGPSDLPSESELPF